MNTKIRQARDCRCNYPLLIINVNLDHGKKYKWYCNCDSDLCQQTKRAKLEKNSPSTQTQSHLKTKHSPSPSNSGYNQSKNVLNKYFKNVSDCYEDDFVTAEEFVGEISSDRTHSSYTTSEDDYVHYCNGFEKLPNKNKIYQSTLISDNPSDNFPYHAK